MKKKMLVLFLGVLNIIGIIFLIFIVKNNNAINGGSIQNSNETAKIFSIFDFDKNSDGNSKQSVNEEDIGNEDISFDSSNNEVEFNDEDSYSDDEVQGYSSSNIPTNDIDETPQNDDSYKTPKKEATSLEEYINEYYEKLRETKGIPNYKPTFTNESKSSNSSLPSLDDLHEDIETNKNGETEVYTPPV